MEIAIVLLGAVAWWFLDSQRSQTRERKNLKNLAVSLNVKQELEKHFEYYQQLSPTNKLKFEKRVQSFINEKQFIPREYSHVSDEMKTLIAASAIQLTFGFRHLNFVHFDKILVYQDAYLSRVTNKHHEGEVHPGGVIVFSWRNFAKGYQDPDDGKNLGLHEMAHALQLENAIENEEVGFIDRKAWRDFKSLALTEMEKMKRSNSNFFREYGASNLHEFFAVAVENFFERPLLFKSYSPYLFLSLSRVLKQDIIRLLQLENESTKA